MWRGGGLEHLSTILVWTLSLCTWAMKCSRHTSPSVGGWSTANPTLSTSPKTLWLLPVGSSSPTCSTERRFFGRFRSGARQQYKRTLFTLKLLEFESEHLESRINRRQIYFVKTMFILCLCTLMVFTFLFFLEHLFFNVFSFLSLLQSLLYWTINVFWPFSKDLLIWSNFPCQISLLTQEGLVQLTKNSYL